MGQYPPEVRRRISGLRWTAALLWLVWLVAATTLYWLYRFMPHVVAMPVIMPASTVVLGLGVVWFIYLIHRIGQLADDGSDEP